MRRWVITPPGYPNIELLRRTEEEHAIKSARESIVEERNAWDLMFKDEAYESVWSMTNDPEVRNRLTRNMSERATQVLIPGCGSRTFLQRHIVEYAPGVRRIVCTDWSAEALKRAAGDFSHPKLVYQEEDTSRMTFARNSFDTVLVVNSILSSNDLLNRRMVQDCFRVLKRGGKLIGFFPTIFAASELANLDTRLARWKSPGIIDEGKNSFFEPAQGMRQLFYTPLRLRQIFHEAGVKRITMEVCFFDSPYFRQESHRIYGLPRGSGLYVWELLVIAEK